MFTNGSLMEWTKYFSDNLKIKSKSPMMLYLLLKKYFNLYKNDFLINIELKLTK